MDSLIKQLGLESEILELYRMGITPREIRKKLQENHPDMQIIPSVPVIYVFLRESKAIAETDHMLIGDITQDVLALNMKLDMLFEDVFRIYNIPNKNRKYISSHRKKIAEYIKEFEMCYSTEDMEGINAWKDKFIDQFRFIVLEGLKTEFPNEFFSKRALELIQEFTKSI
jgi:hypothetical protein